jgi:poly(3-hydroxybutyrate) depolymerase
MDDISGIGQTQAAHALCSSIPDELKQDYIQPKVGHYGVFNGSRFRKEIAPAIAEFILTQEMVAAMDRRAPPRLRKVVG